MSTFAPLPPPYIVLIVIYHLFIVPDYWPLSPFPFYQDWYWRRKKKSKWVIHYDPKISRKAESIIPLLLLFKSSPQSFPPPTPQSSPPPPVMVDAHLTSTVPPLTDTQLFALLKN